jgi:hypothetical protein
LDGSTSLWGTPVSDIQSDISVDNTNCKITGNLISIDSGALVDKWGEGYFIALDLNKTANKWENYTSVKIGMNPSESSGLIEIIDDPDKAGVFKVTDKDTQTFVIHAIGPTGSVEQTFDLSELVLLEPPTPPEPPEPVSYDEVGQWHLGEGGVPEDYPGAQGQWEFKN